MTFLAAMVTIHDKVNLGKGRIISATGFRESSPSWRGRLGGRVMRLASYSVSAFRTQRLANAGVFSFSSVYSVQDSIMVACLQGLPFFLKALWKHPHRHTQRHVK